MTPIDWNAIIWTVIWVVGALVVLGLITWIVFASFAARQFKAISKDFDKGFDSDFFKSTRNRF